MPARPLVLVFLLLCVYPPLHARSKHLIVTGKLIEVPSGGADPVAWAIQLNPVITMAGRQLSALEIKTPHPEKLEPLRDEFVQAKGILTPINGFDSADPPVLELSSIHSVKSNHADKDHCKLCFWTSLANFFSVSFEREQLTLSSLDDPGWPNDVSHRGLRGFT